MKARFIGEQITVEFDKLPFLEKSPNCPDRFVWRGESYDIVELQREWRAYDRRGRMADNMKPSHVEMAAQRGSWGVGRFYFRVRVADGRVFELYYDRAPKDVDRRKGAWFLTQELGEG
jgi:hypothetical protein